GRTRPPRRPLRHRPLLPDRVVRGGRIMTAPTPPAATRRSFLKWGAAAAAPLAAAAPAVAQTDDTAERLARLEDMEAIRALHAALLRAVNSRDADAARALSADPQAAPIAPNLRRIVLDHRPEGAPVQPAAANRGHGTARG